MPATNCSLWNKKTTFLKVECNEYKTTVSVSLTDVDAYNKKHIQNL